MLKLYQRPGAVSLAAHIALIEAGAKFEMVPIDFETSEQRSPAYLEINPKGRVPSLITDRGILTETPAILVYIAQTHPKAKLAPLNDPFAFAQMQAFNVYLASTVHVTHAHKSRGRRWTDEPDALAALTRAVPEKMFEVCALVENDLLKGPWVMGDDYTLADPYLFTISRWIEADGIELSRLPRIRDHQARMFDRPAVQRALAEEGLA